MGSGKKHSNVEVDWASIPSVSTEKDLSQLIEKLVLKEFNQPAREEAP